MGENEKANRAGGREKEKKSGERIKGGVEGGEKRREVEDRRNGGERKEVKWGEGKGNKGKGEKEERGEGGKKEGKGGKGEKKEGRG